MRYERRRNRIIEGGSAVLAEAVRLVLAVANEPRLDGVSYPQEFKDFVDATRVELHMTLAGVTTAEGGRIEATALRLADDLRTEAVRLGLAETAAFIECAIDRCNHGPETEVPIPQSFQEPKRIPGGDGRPIALWR
jgi:hypothetical protein